MKHLGKLLIIAGFIVSLSLNGWFSVNAIEARIDIDNDPALELIQQGRQYYHQGKFIDAIKALQQAQQIYQEAEDIVGEAQSLSLLSLPYEELGSIELAENAIASSLSLLETLPAKKSQNRVLARVINRQGRFLFNTGKTQQALEKFQNAEFLYKKEKDKLGVIGSQINQAQALQHLGFYRRSKKLLIKIENSLENEPDSWLKIQISHNLGNILRQEGELTKSQTTLEQSLAMLDKLIATEPELLAILSDKKSQILFSLANTERALVQREKVRNNLPLAKTYFQASLSHYQEAATTTNFPVIATQAKLNQLSLLIQQNQHNSTHTLISEINSLLPQLPISRPSIDAKINFAKSLAQIEPNQAQIPQILNRAIEEAQNLQDKKVESYGLGTLGKFYEQQQDWQQAKKLTLSALLIARDIYAPEISYQWQWQMGRTIQQLQAQTSRDRAVATEALNYYTQAFNTLNELRSDLAILNPEIQFSFRETVEPVYRQLVDLLLRSPQPDKANLIQARNVIEALQLAELDNFFQDACAKPTKIDIDNLDASAAVIYPIILENRLEIILKLPGKNNLNHYVVENIAPTEIDLAVQQLRRSLTRRSTSLGKLKQESQQIYEWLVQPLLQDLDDDIQTLVFVLDGSLRNLPMATLYDGQQYLIEKYAVAVTPGLQLLETQSLPSQKLNILLAGATNAPSFEAEGLSPIGNVATELTEIARQFSNNQKLAQQDFIEQNIKNLIDSVPFNVVHIATHGTFSSNPEQTYLLDWEERIGVKDLENLLRVRGENVSQPIELLVLSACETASGDNRAALGLAGIAIRAGTRSTLATLWQVNDASTAEFMTQFYRQLKNPQTTKAEALRQAQIAFLTQYPDTDYNRPYHWASFILVGNWL